MHRPWSDKKSAWLLLCGIVAAAAIGLAAFLPARASNLVAEPTGWTTQGCFNPVASNGESSFNYQFSAHERVGVNLWKSRCGDDADTGELRSPSFEAPVVLELFIAGHIGAPDMSGLQLFLEREEDHRRIPLKVWRAPIDRWMKVHWWVPVELRGKTVRFVAVDQQGGLGGWLGVSNPRQLSVVNYVRLQLKSWVRTMVAYLYHLALFLLPGFALAAMITAKNRKTPLAGYQVMVVFCSGAVLGYLSFWAFFFSAGLGQALSWAAEISSAFVLLFLLLRRREAVKASLHAIREPFLWATLAGLCYTSFYFAFADPFYPEIGYVGDRFFARILAPDNIIPRIFADRIWDRKPLRPFCCTDWLSSDRPPLQAGIILLERPLSPMEDTDLSYQLLSTALQCFWICGVWCFLKSIGADRQRIRQVLGFLIFSGFLFYNSVFTWPKLLAATCILFLLSILFEKALTKRLLSYFEAVLAATSLGIALMAHPGVTFSLAACALTMVRLRRFIGFRQFALGLLIVVAFYAPWLAYQKYVDPPGNRLLKLHLAGVAPIDARSTWQAIRDSYHERSWAEIANYKWLNIAFIAGEKFFDSYGLGDLSWLRIDHAATEKSRSAQGLYVWNGVGLVNAGWLAMLALAVKQRKQAVAIPYAGWLIIAALTNFLVWSLVTFGPRATLTAHSSYADLLLLSIGLLGFILALPRVFFLLLFAWQLLNFWVVWVWSLPARVWQPVAYQAPMIISGVLLAIALVWLTFRREAPANGGDLI